jgi:hypothetical protein
VLRTLLYAHAAGEKEKAEPGPHLPDGFMPQHVKLGKVELRSPGARRAHLIALF